MKIERSVALVTGSNRGLGKALVPALLEAGAAKVYAAARDARMVAADERYDGCSGAWGFYVNETLRSFLAAGAGQPDPDEHRSHDSGR